MTINVGCRDCEFDHDINLSSKTATSAQIGSWVSDHLTKFPEHRVEVTKA